MTPAESNEWFARNQQERYRLFAVAGQIGGDNMYQVADSEQHFRSVRGGISDLDEGIRVTDRLNGH